MEGKKGIMKRMPISGAARGTHRGAWTTTENSQRVEAGGRKFGSAGTKHK